MRLTSAAQVRPAGSSQLMSAVGRAVGSPMLLGVQTLVIAGWLVANAVLERIYRAAHPGCLHVANGVASYVNRASCRSGVHPLDPYPFAFLVLAVSVQAAYAAPLVLLAQNRRSGADRGRNVHDPITRRQIRADLSYLADEIAATRRALDVALRREDVRRELPTRGLSSDTEGGI